jgi:hypothetical protein
MANSEQDDPMINYINSMLFGQNSSTVGGRFGPISGSYTETTPRFSANPLGPSFDRPPERAGSISYGGDVGGDIRAFLTAAGSQSPEGGTSLFPRLTLQGGPLTLGGGLSYDTRGGEGSVRPNFNIGAGFSPFDNAFVSGDLNVTPGQSRNFGLQGTYNLSDNTSIAALLNYLQHDDPRNKPEFRIGAALKHKFPAGRDPYYEPQNWKRR